MTVKWKIGTKLQLSNLALIATVVLVMAISFQLISSSYLKLEAKRQMKADAAMIAGDLKNLRELSGGDVTEKVQRLTELRVAGKLLQSKIVIIDNNNRIVYTNSGINDQKTLKELDKQNNKDFLIERQQIRNADGVVKGRIVLAAKIKDISGLSRLLRGVQFVSIVIGGIVALAAGSLLGRNLAQPIRMLAGEMRRFSPKKEIPRLNIATRDEIRELADSFIGMAEKLQENEKQQIHFLQNASHELKTPLMAIQGNAEAVKDGIVQGKEAQESLNVIIAECQHLKSVVDELIYLTKLDQTAEFLHKEGAFFEEVIQEAAGSLRMLAEQKKITLEVRGEAGLAGSFDREKLRRALVNMIGNAIRYAKSSVIVEAKRMGGNRMEIVCRDDGKGFAPGEENRVFDRFYKGEEGGTGIGLAIAKATVEAHGGSIAAQQAEKGGAVFRIELPI